MKVSLALGPRGTISRQNAWACFGANAALPGAGSLAAGRKVGYVQVVLAVAGLMVSGMFMLRFAAWYVAHRAELQDDLADPVANLLALWRALRWALAGLGLFGFGWLWALVSSLQILSGAEPPADARNAGASGSLPS